MASDERFPTWAFAMRRLVKLLFCLLALPAAAQDRLALVIGNNAYASVPVLAKAVADADAVSGALEAQGYRIFKATDVARREMNRTISDFTSALQPGGTAVVFYAGHGVEISGENYLLPTDIVAPASGDSDFVRSESIALSSLLDRVRATGARMAIVIVDACRDNPFEVSTGRSIGRTRGLGRIAAPEGTFVIFSAGAGQLALDRLNDGEAEKNSVFTRALLPRLSEPGLELRAMVADLRREVRGLAQSVQHDQTPAYYDELLGEFYFTPADVRGFETEEVPGAAPPPPAPAADRMRDDFELARSVGTAAALDAFLARYADRKGDLAYQLAETLRRDLGETVAMPSSKVPAAEARASAALLRETQAALNARGCNAGTPDGVVGPRTRAAFGAFLAETGSDLRAESLGTEAALAAVRAAPGRVCAAPSAPTPPAAAPGQGLAGTWSFRASCAMFITTTGTMRLTRVGANTFRGPISDSLGQNGRIELRLGGRSIDGQTFFPAASHTYTGALDADGMGFTIRGTSTCTTRAVRVN